VDFAWFNVAVGMSDEHRKKRFAMRRWTGGMLDFSSANDLQ
jgi:hypothetical protein